MQYLHWTAQHKQTGIVHRPGVMLYPALIICLRMNRRLVYQFCCCFGDAFISRFKECLNMKCLEIRKKSNLKEKYYQSMKKNMHLLFIQGACLKFMQLEKFTREITIMQRQRGCSSDLLKSYPPFFLYID